MDKGKIYIHLPTGQRGTVHWEPTGKWGHFVCFNGVEFTVAKNEVCTLKELEAA